MTTTTTPTSSPAVGPKTKTKRRNLSPVTHPVCHSRMSTIRLPRKWLNLNEIVLLLVSGWEISPRTGCLKLPSRIFLANPSFLIVLNLHLLWRLLPHANPWRPTSSTSWEHQALSRQRLMLLVLLPHVTRLRRRNELLVRTHRLPVKVANGP